MFVAMLMLEDDDREEGEKRDHTSNGVNAGDSPKELYRGRREYMNSRAEVAVEAGLQCLAI